uniref:Uncharacterized protein n=1 Tax=Myotis myotis TaxID=51298 RepID=A0A7J7XZN9_MYOMY|nr:hypothetical protein mMyoMyo1_011392 [Myotis myotis]
MVSNLIHFYVSKILSPKCNVNNILKHSASMSQGERWMANVASQLSLLQGTDSPATLQPETCKDPEGTLHIEKPFSFLTQHKATCPTHQDVFSERSRGRDENFARVIQSESQLPTKVVLIIKLD